MWFETLTGFPEESPQQVRENITVDGQELKSHINGKVLVCGQLETPTLAELRERVQASGHKGGKISVREVVANVQHLHTNASNAGSLFQVASQFNLLEMASPCITPEHGVGIYEQDCTQGPACAVAAGAGTIYRNYFASVNGAVGQSEKNQIDCLADLGRALGNKNCSLWDMRNGYALANEHGLAEIARHLKGLTEGGRDELRQLLRIGIQWNTEVTLGAAGHLVCQAYCSALPVAYSSHPSRAWEPFARLILEASYEATFHAAIVNFIQNGSNQLFLTMLGGGAFGNEAEWISDAMNRALSRCSDATLDVAIVSYGSSNPHAQAIATKWGA